MVPFKNQCLWPSCSLGNCLMLLQTLLYDKCHRGLSFPTKINQIGPCVQILWPENHQNLDISFGTWLFENDHKNRIISKSNCFRVLVMFLNDLPYLIRLGKSIFITKKFYLASGRDFLVWSSARACARIYQPIFARPKIDQTLFLHQPVVLMAATGWYNNYPSSTFSFSVALENILVKRARRARIGWPP